MFDFAYSYTWDEFLHDYILQHLIVYPVIIMAAALIVIFFLRLRGATLVRVYMGKSLKYYDRVHYMTIKMMVVTSMAIVCILIIVSIALNANVTRKMDDTIDKSFGAVDYTLDIAVKAQNYLDSLKNTTIKLNASDIIGSQQSVILNDIDNITATLKSVNQSLSAFSENVVQMTANYSAQSREIIESLQQYPQLTGVPSVDEIPTIDASTVQSELSTATSSIQESLNQMAGIRSKVTNLNVNVDLSSATGAIDSAVSQIDDVKVKFYVVLNKSNEVYSDAHKYNNLRMGILFITYIVPVLIICLGILGVEIRSAPVIKPWYHLLLIGAGFCAFCAALYMCLPVIINDACDSPQTTIFTALRSADGSAMDSTWYKYFSEYYPILSTCVHGEFFLNYVDLPESVTSLLNQTYDISSVLNLNYTGLILNATAQLDQGMDNLDSVNISLLNANSTKEKLANVSAQLDDLTKFGFSWAVYNASIDNINAQTSFINATFPNGTWVVYALYYTASNMSLLQISQFPYNYTTTTYQTTLNTSVIYFYTINDTYTQVLALTQAIQQNITAADNMIDSMDSIAGDFEVVKLQANASFQLIDATANNITQIVSNLTNSVSSDLLPQLTIVNTIWGTITNMTDCGYVGDVYNDAEDFVCTTFFDFRGCFPHDTPHHHCYIMYSLLRGLIRVHVIPASLQTIRHDLRPAFGHAG